MTVRKKAALALIGIWIVAGLAVFAARSSAPTADSVIGWLRANDHPHRRGNFAVALATKFVRLRPGDRGRVMESDEFARAIRGFGAAEHEQFLTGTVPGGIQVLLTGTYAKRPEARRAFFSEKVATTRRVFRLDDEQVNRPHLKLLILRGIAAYSHETSGEERLAMTPFIQDLHASLEWM